MDDSAVYAVCIFIFVATSYGKGVASASLITGHVAFSTARFLKAHRTESMLVLGKVVWCHGNVILRLAISTSVLASKWLSLLFLASASPLVHMHADVVGVALLFWAMFAPKIQSRLHRSWLYKLEATEMEEKNGLTIT